MGDVTDLFKIYSDKEAMKYRGSKPMQTLDDAKQYVKNRELKEGNILTLREGIELVQTKELIGSVMYRYDEHKKNECEIGYSIGRQFWGQGFGKVIVKLMVKTLEEETSTQTITAWSNKENIASIKILEKLGFQQIDQTESQENNLYILNLILSHSTNFSQK